MQHSYKWQIRKCKYPCLPFFFVLEAAESFERITLRQKLNMEKTKMTIVKNGPLRVEGDFEILDPNGQVYGLGGRTLVSLCRCGHSKNKPYCDGTHKSVDWQEEAVAFDLPPKKIL